MAALVSAVSPDCDMAIIRHVLSINGSIYLNSDAISTLTGFLASLSITYLPTSPACIAVPQATIYILLYADNFCISNPSAEKSGRPSVILGVTVVLKDVGCS